MLALERWLLSGVYREPWTAPPVTLATIDISLITNQRPISTLLVTVLQGCRLVTTLP